jgi:alkanesulfonate monooxygenase SsuD/methylene tetrahydromethanopterin reductase-like flavin-dependent oxidoreductase (luciferase family)
MEAYGVPKVDPKTISLQRLDVALQAWAKAPQDPPLHWKTDLEEGILGSRIMPISHRRNHPLLGFATNTDSTIEMAAKRGWPVQMGRYNLVESARKTKLYKDALEAAGHPQALVDECLAHTNLTKAIVVAETDEEAWALAERQLRGFMNFTFKVATRRDLDDSRSMKALWEATVEGPVDISHAGFTAPEWIQASAFIGSPETVARQMLDYSAAGIDHINARFVYGDFDAEAAWRGFHLFAKEVMPRVGAKSLAPPRPEQIRDEHRDPSLIPAATLSKMFA